MTKSKHVRPQCLVLAVCDAVIEDVRSRNKSLVNMFNGILTPACPARHDKMCVFASFTQGRGPVPLTLRLCHDADYDKDLLRLNGQLDFPTDNPWAVVDMVFEIRGFVFPRFGQYSFEVLCEEVPIVVRRFTVAKPPEGKPPLPGQTGTVSGGPPPPDGDV